MLKENRMLKGITKMFSKEAEAETKQTTTETLTVKIDASEFTAEIEKLQAELESFKAEANGLIAQADAEKAELKGSIETMQGVIASLEAEKAELIAQAQATKMAVRKEQVVALIGEDRADALMTVTENMDDAAFNAVLTAMSVTTEVEANSKMFKEQGIDAEADASKVAEESTVMKLLKQKYADAAQA